MHEHRNSSKFRQRDTYSSSRSKPSYTTGSIPNTRNIARAQEFQGRPSSPIVSSNSKWDMPPRGLEKYSAQQVKLAGVFSPGRKLSQAEIQSVLRKLSVPQIDPESSVLNRSLIIQGEKSPYLEDLFHRIGISPVYSQIGAITKFDSPMHAALVMACPGSLSVRRPPGLVTSDSPDIWSNQLTRILDPQQAAKLGRSQIKQIKDVDGVVVAQFTTGGTLGTPLYPIPNNAPVYSNPDDFDKVPPHVSSTLVVLNGQTEDVRKLLEDQGALNIKTACQRITKVFARFDSPENASKVGQQLHLKQCGPEKLLVGYWSDDAFNMDIF